MRWLPLACVVALLLSGCAASPPAPTEDTQVASATQTTTASTTPAVPTITNLTTNVTGLAVAFAFNATAANGTLGWSLAFGDGNQTNGTGLPGAANHTYAAAGSYNATLTVRNGAASANRTLMVNVTVANVTGPVIVLATYQFTGSLPMDSGDHTFEAAPGVTQVTMTYTSEHIGLFSAVASATDPAGTRQMYSLDDCGVGLTPGAETETCAMATDVVMPGTWSANVAYQAGQVTEDYTLDIVVYGVAA